MKVSVIVTTYNGMTYIEEQLNSLRNQTRPADEVLICDDCSTDNTYSFVLEYIQKYEPRGWVAVKNDKNLGWKRNFIECIKKISGDCFFFCDQDDIWDIKKIEIMTSYMETNSEINVLTCKYTDFNEKGLQDERPEDLSGTIVRQPFKADFLKIIYPGCTYCVRKIFADNILRYWREELPHDAFFWRIGLVSGTLYTVNNSLIKYRRHADSTFSVEDNERRTRQKRLDWISYAYRVIKDIQCYINEFDTDTLEKQKYISGTEKWLNLRENFLRNRNFISGLKLVLYYDRYISFKQYLGDWMAVFCG